MIVTCEKCSTQFKLDDARVPDQGVKVRCSRCKHAFHVERPPTGERRVDRAVEHVLDGDTQELDGDDTRPGGDASPFDDSFDDSVDDAVEESDWEFNTEKPAAAAPAEREDASIESLLGDPPAPGESLTGSDEPGGPSDAEGPTPLPTVAGELGSPEEWNFFTDEPGAAAPVPQTKPAAKPGVAIGKLGSAPTVERAAPARGYDGASARLGLWLGRGFGGIGWAAVIGLSAALVATGVALPKPTPEVAPGVQSLGSLEARDVEGHWLENAVAGPILVVSGELASSARSRPDGWIAVRLLDRRGDVVDEDAGAVGPALSTLELREADPRELRAAQASAALAMTRAAPGSRRRFHAVLHPVPPEAARFELVAVPAGQRPLGVEPARDEPEG